MRQANYQEKGKIIEILKTAFNDIPNIQWIVGNDERQHEKKLHRFFEFVVALTFEQGEIGIADNGKGVILYFYQHKRKLTLKVLWLYLKFIVQIAGYRKLIELLKRESYCKKVRPNAQKFIYVWFIGALPHEEKATVVDLKNSIFKKSAAENLPIYIETTIVKARTAYIRYGFHVFHEWNNLGNHITTWFLKREPSNYGITQ